MAARKKPASKTPSPPLDAAGLGIILEDMRSQFTVFGEALESSREEAARRSQQLEDRMVAELALVREALQSTREESARRFERIDQRLDQHDARFSSLERASLENGRDIREVRRDLGEVRRTIDRIESGLASKVNRDEVESIVQSVLARPDTPPHAPR
jgi:chromosome segregation ATPase